MVRFELRHLKGAWFAFAAIIVPGLASAQSAVTPSVPEPATTLAPGSEDSLRVSVGATYAEGRYGQTARTEVATLPVSIKYTHARFSVKVTVPYVHIHGPGTLLDGTGSGASGSGSSGGSGGGVVSEKETETETGAGSTGTGGGSGEAESGASIIGPIVPVGPVAAPLRNRGGIGDTTVTLAYSLPLSEQISLEPRGRIKLPTASSRKGIGTGKVDVTLAADVVGTFGPTSVYAGARRRFLGRSVQFPLRDGWGFGGGASHQITSALTLGADYDWLQSAAPGRGPISEGSLWISAKLSRQVRLQAYGGAGFSARSADALGGLTLVWKP